MPTARVREHEWERERQFMPFLFKSSGKKAKKDANLELFEKGLANEIKKDDTIDSAITKIVRMALCAEFGAAAIKSKNAAHMIEVIKRGIMSDPELRKQALMIVDRFAK